MSYADQSMSSNRIIALVIVALLHIALVYALVTGLAYEGYKKVLQRVTAVDIKEEVKKEPPPPPKKLDIKPPPIVVPPPRINVTVAPQVIETVREPPPAPPPIVLAPPAAPPPPRFTAKGAVAKGRPGDWANSNDYPARALREEREGVTRFRVTVGTDGRVTGCTITGSSGHGDLDEATCTLITRRGRFTPAMDGDGQPTTGSFSSAVRWQIPKD